MDQDAIIQYITDTFTGIEIVRPTDGLGAGDTFIYYDPQHDLDPARRLPFTTIVKKDREITHGAARCGGRARGRRRMSARDGAMRNQGRPQPG